MTIIGPFLRLYPTTSACHQQWRYCFIWLDGHGREIAIEWH